MLPAGLTRPILVVALGGECSLVVGSRESRRGRPGMLWMDSYGDFNTLETTPSRFIGGMCLAFASGDGPEMTERLDKNKPLVEKTSLVHLGGLVFDPPEVERMRESAVWCYGVAAIQKKGPIETAKEICSYLENSSDWFVCHLDFDVMDPRSFPAVNYPEAGGLNPGAVLKRVRILRSTGKLRLLDVASYNPEKDTDLSSRRFAVRLVSEILS
jgi:arginase family enzyme